MNDATPYESACLYDSEESTVETELSTVEDKKEEEKEDKFIACSHCGSKYKFLPTLKVPEDIFPPQNQFRCLCDMSHIDALDTLGTGWCTILEKKEVGEQREQS
jgi:DNA-directed RNA polymerase subunit RPC12/RpoP